MQLKKYNLLCPIAGDARRFMEAGYLMPKPMIPCGQRSIVEYAMQPFDIDEVNLIFIVQKSHILDFSIDEFLYSKFGKDIHIKVLDEKTDGALCTCIAAEEFVNKALPLVIFTPDVTFGPRFDISVYNNWDGGLHIFKANSSDHSYVRVNDKNEVLETKEKVVISGNAAVGLYYFKSPQVFFNFAKKMVAGKDKSKNEYYICPIYNYLVEEGLRSTIFEVEKMYVLGTPRELEFYEKNVFHHNGINIGLCSDHSGFNTKNIFKSELKNYDIEVFDYGCFSTRGCDYNPYVAQTCRQLEKGVINMAFAFCRTGQGVNIAANKNKGVRSALIYDLHSAEMAVRHNCANFFCFGSDQKAWAKDFIKKIFESSFDGGRHYNRISILENV